MSETDKQRWRDKLSPQAFHVCWESGTEAPFTGKLLHNRRTGFYHCICCEQPLFHSSSKFDAGCGWPSFDRPYSKESVSYHDDFSHGMQRVEIRCGHCGAHLGHVFPDGPTETGDRYCVNSVALDFHAQSDQK